MTNQDVTRLVEQLKQRFDAQIESEQISPGRFRLNVLSPHFAGVESLHRQDRIWEAIDALLDREMTLDISMVLAFSPDEVEPVTNV